jgi:methyltransferase (TIGR00027 family)
VVGLEGRSNLPTIKNLKQLVILGGGYDTWAYRIEGGNRMGVFEVDHPGTQGVEIQKVEQIFRRLPEHVVYVPVDFLSEDIESNLFQNGYNKSHKTLFVMERRVMYLPPMAVDDILSFVSKNSGKGSSILFDYYRSQWSMGRVDLNRQKT